MNTKFWRLMETWTIWGNALGGNHEFEGQEQDQGQNHSCEIIVTLETVKVMDERIKTEHIQKKDNRGQGWHSKEPYHLAREGRRTLKVNRRGQTRGRRELYPKIQGMREI